MNKDQKLLLLRSHFSNSFSPCSNVSFGEVVQALYSAQKFKHHNNEHGNFFLPFVLCLFGFNVIISPVSTCCVVRALLLALCELFTGEAVLNIPATVK